MEYPYISTISVYEENKIMILFAKNELSITDVYDMNTFELKSLTVNVSNSTNELESGIATSLSASTLLIGDDMDMNISNGLSGALSDNSTESKVIYNKYKDPVWIVTKTKNDESKYTNFSITKSGLEYIK